MAGLCNSQDILTANISNKMELPCAELQKQLAGILIYEIQQHEPASPWNTSLQVHEIWDYDSLKSEPTSSKNLNFSVPETWAQQFQKYEPFSMWNTIPWVPNIWKLSIHEI